MFRKHFYTIVVLTWLSGSVFSNDSFMQSDDFIFEDDKKNSLNVILFLVQPNDTSIRSNITDLPPHNFETRGTAAPCVNKTLNLPKNIRDVFFPAMDDNCNCDEAFHENMLSLINWCKNVMEMSIGWISTLNMTLLKEDEIFGKNDHPFKNMYPVLDEYHFIRLPKSTQLKNKDPKIYELSVPTENIFSNIFESLPVESIAAEKTEPVSVIKLVNDSDLEDDTPLLGSYNSGSDMSFFEDVYKYNTKPFNAQKKNVHELEEPYFVKNVEINLDTFPSKIQNTDSKGVKKRNVQLEVKDLEHDEIQNKNIKKKSNEKLDMKLHPVWPIPSKIIHLNDRKKRVTPQRSMSTMTPNIFDLIRIMSEIRKSFFDEFLDTIGSTKNEKYHEDKGDINLFSPVREPTLIEMVRNTLKNLKDQYRTSAGYLFVIVGGSMDDFSKVNSSISQSLKYVIENTRRDDTLIVVSSFCPKPTNKTLNSKEKHVNDSVVYFANGSKSNLLLNVSEISDIPKYIEKAISEFAHQDKSNEKRNIFPSSALSKEFDSHVHKRMIGEQNWIEIHENDETPRLNRNQNLSKNVYFNDFIINNGGSILIFTIYILLIPALNLLT